MPSTPIIFLAVSVATLSRSIIGPSSTASAFTAYSSCNPTRKISFDDVGDIGDPTTSLWSSDVNIQTKQGTKGMIRIPLLVAPSRQAQQDLQHVLETNVIGSSSVSDFFNDVKMQHQSSLLNWEWSCAVPAFGEDCRVFLTLEDDGEDTINGMVVSEPVLVLSLSDKESLVENNNDQTDGGQDLAWVCSRLLECSEALEEVLGIDVISSALRPVVVGLHSSRPPDPGVAAVDAEWSRRQQSQFENLIICNNNGNKASSISRAAEIELWIDKLQTEKFIVMDSSPGEPNESSSPVSGESPLTTSTTNHEFLSDYVASESTGQGENIRTDQVHFLSRPQALDCGVEEQYDLLMGIANFLNRNIDETKLSETDASKQSLPMSPGTFEKPLTNPSRIQFAEYGQDDFYIVCTIC